MHHSLTLAMVPLWDHLAENATITRGQRQMAGFNFSSKLPENFRQLANVFLHWGRLASHMKKFCPRLVLQKNR